MAELDPLPALDPSVAELVDAYKVHTHRDASEVEAALQRVAANVTVAAPSGSAGATSAVTKIALATAVAAGGAWLATRTDEPVATAPTVLASTVEASPRAPIEPAPAAPVARIHEPVAAEPPVASPEPRPASPEPATEPPRPRTSSSRTKPRAQVGDDTNATSLAEELALLRQARADLRAGRADEALGRVRAHRQQHPDSTFAEERDATEILALCAIGRSDDARARATTFSLAYPASTRDVLAGCDDGALPTTPSGAPR